MEARASELPRIGAENWYPSTPARLLEKAVYQGGFAMVYVGDDRNIS